MKAARVFITDMAEQISMPNVYSDIRNLIEQQDSSVQDFVKVIENDSMLKVRLMRIANSPYFGFPRRAENLHQAISLFGFIQLHDLVLNSLSLRIFTSIPQQIFSLKDFWKYSIECGIVARTIAQYAQIIPLNPYFTFALVHEIGHVVMFFKTPELSLQALEESKQENVALIDKEQELFGFDYTEAGSAMMELWHLPERYQQITAYHLNPQQADEHHRQALNIVHLSHNICQAASADEIKSLIEELKVKDDELKKLPHNIEQIILKEIADNADNVLDILWPQGAQELPLIHGLHSDE